MSPSHSALPRNPTSMTDLSGWTRGKSVDLSDRWRDDDVLFRYDVSMSIQISIPTAAENDLSSWFVGLLRPSWKRVSLRRHCGKGEDVDMIWYDLGAQSAKAIWLSSKNGDLENLSEFHMK